MNDQDRFDDLDLAIAALPLEEPPAHLHARIMAATVYRPRAAVAAWEPWAVGTLLAVAAWLTWLFATSPNAVNRAASAASDAVNMLGLTSDTTVLWLAVGASIAWWIAQLSVPANLRVRIR